MGLDVTLYLFEGFDPDCIVSFLRRYHTVQTTDWGRSERPFPWQPTEQELQRVSARVKEITDELGLPDAEEVNRSGIRVGFQSVGSDEAASPILVRGKNDAGFDCISSSTNELVGELFGKDFAVILGVVETNHEWLRPIWDKVYWELRYLVHDFEARRTYYSEVAKRLPSALSEEDIAANNLLWAVATLKKVLTSVGCLRTHPMGSQVIVNWG